MILAGHTPMCIMKLCQRFFFNPTEGRVFSFARKNVARQGKRRYDYFNQTSTLGLQAQRFAPGTVSKAQGKQPGSN